MILKGIKVLEITGLGPGQFCGKVLRDFGATVTRIDKIAENVPGDFLGYGKSSVAINLKNVKGRDILKKMTAEADVLIEGFRPGVMERLGLGPEEIMNQNKRLIYTRLSGYGQTGRYSKKAGHDINFLSMSGLLSLTGGEHKLPYNSVVSDYAGGGFLGAFGVLLALYDRERSGLGQVVDVSMTRGASYLISWIMDSLPTIWNKPVGQNQLDGGFNMYNLYKTKDDKWMAVGSNETKFYNNLLTGLGLVHDDCPYSSEKGIEVLKKKFLDKSQAEWIEIFDKLDACVTPVLSVEETIRDRPEDFVRNVENGRSLPLPEPRFSRSKTFPSANLPLPAIGEDTVNALLSLGYSQEDINQLASEKVVYFPNKLK